MKLQNYEIVDKLHSVDIRKQADIRRKVWLRRQIQLRRQMRQYQVTSATTQKSHQMCGPLDIFNKINAVPLLLDMIVAIII